MNLPEIRTQLSIRKDGLQTNGRRSIAEVTEILNNEVFLKTKFKPFEYSVKLCNRLGEANLLLEFVKTNAHDPSDFIGCYIKTHTNEPQP